MKGLSEREVPAGVAVWTIGYNGYRRRFGRINWKLSDSTKAVIAFLKTAGLDDKDAGTQVGPAGRRCDYELN